MEARKVDRCHVTEDFDHVFKVFKLQFLGSRELLKGCK